MCIYLKKVPLFGCYTSDVIVKDKLSGEKRDTTSGTSRWRSMNDDVQGAGIFFVARHLNVLNTKAQTCSPRDSFT